MAVSYLTKAAMVKESAWGGGSAAAVIASNAGFLIPVQPTSFTETFEHILDDGMRGLPAKDYMAYAGVTNIEGSIEGPFYPEETGWLIYGILGSDNYTTNHAFTLATSTPSYAIEFADTVQNVRYYGMRVNSFTLRFNAAEGFVNWTAGFTGKAGSTSATAAAFPADATRQPLRGWEAVATCAGTANTSLQECEITISRPTDPTYTANNSQSMSALYHGPLEVTARATFDYNQTTELNLNRNDTHGNLVLSFSASSNSILVVSMGSMQFAEGPYEIDRSGTHTTIALAGRALYYSTDSGPIKITLTNSRGSAY